MAHAASCKRANDDSCANISPPLTSLHLFRKQWAEAGLFSRQPLSIGVMLCYISRLPWVQAAF
eukprot:CAMPEP_0174307822 /NCGR_PEP_ID=MMETSP0810-20121108/1359_1 /TAXON_ID=73025 ORGANISM="Eutreptiella gymnastica-like, Strain CCMP1594" /NCGR_SAMPLE_ID=MMETSP0810 /ASSEMBLY_ACC=CAM_ASM_000659 /LENGTH=62 /DNA_ID=CAMNT_0015414969 /DNA_START=522 /DNA_END=710 /DNA_ORIENTATION=+